MDYQPPSPSLIKMAGMAILVLVPVIYGIIAINTGDLLWASPVFSYQPQSMVIHCFGEDIFPEAGSSDFVALTQLINQSLTGRKRWDSLSISDVTYEEYQSHPKMMVVELSYPEPIRVHSRYKFFSNVDRLIIPLVGRHAQTNPVFGRHLNFPVPGSFHVNDLNPVKDYMTENGLCVEP